MKSWRERLSLPAVIATGASPTSALWTFPTMIGAAFLVAWGAEAAEFLISEGLALAILALIQTMPEFAVEAVIAWKAGKDPDMVHLAIANFTGSLRLLTGLGWPMIYGVAAFYSRKRHKKKLGSIHLHDDHAVEVVGLLPPLAYFVVVWAKGSLSLVDAAILTSTYGVSVGPAQDAGARGDDRAGRGDPARLPLGALVQGLEAVGGGRVALSRGRRRHLPGRRAFPRLADEPGRAVRLLPVCLLPVARP